MSRKTSCRLAASAAVRLHQDQALHTTLFLLKSFGPTGFLLREEGGVNVKVFLGDPHTCTCPVFTKEREPCKHICWVLLRKFRLPREHEYSFQHGLVERQILEVLHGVHQTKDCRTGRDPSAASGAASPAPVGRDAGSVCRKAIQAQDVCPICQEGLLEKKQPVSHCRFGCGNNVHVSCMKVWAEHQRLSGREEAVKCPLCREDFSSWKLLQEQARNAATLFTASEREKPDRHLGVMCHGCRLGPVTGTCFKCTVCRHLYLCEDCSVKGRHRQHPLASRTKRSEEWRLVDLNDEPQGATSQSANDIVVPAVGDSLQGIVPDRLHAVRVRPGSRLLEAGQQCRLCLQDFSLGQRVRTLPCRHKFHADCVDGILRESNSCPLDGYIIYSPSPWTASEKKTSSKLFSSPRPVNDLTDLFIPGVALRDRNTKAAPPHGSLHLEVLTGSSVTFNTSQEMMTDTFQGLCVAAEEGKLTLLPPGSSSDSLARSSKKTHAKSPSPTMRAAAAAGRERPPRSLFVGLRRPGSDHTAAPPARPARPQPRRPRGTSAMKHTVDRLDPDLRMTGVLINTQQRNTDT
ncbi:E3 ubiquitin-protein ligase ZSWIM2 [Clinocottus analis]|uniref:E3 ubiquitin-protein ligase ZSWIM2 n=1 Tax=Clinocottus analis TaxID=304258 RepID=UPI0035BFC656